MSGLRRPVADGLAPPTLGLAVASWAGEPDEPQERAARGYPAEP